MHLKSKTKIMLLLKMLSCASSPLYIYVYYSNPQARMMWASELAFQIKDVTECTINIACFPN